MTDTAPQLKRCSRSNPTKHEQGAMLPLKKFYRNKQAADGHSNYCKACEADVQRKSYQKEKQEKLFAQGNVDAAEGTIDPKFIIAEAVKLYQDASRVEQKIKLLELMAKYSPEMKNAKPQDKVALMASLMESLKKEKATDAIPKGSNVQTDNVDVVGQ